MVESTRPPRPSSTSVYYDDEDVDEEFNCSICWNLMCQPVTTTCGHTFCKACLQSTLRHKRECIMCRTPVFQQTCIRQLPVNIMLQNIIEKRYPKTSAKLKQIQEKQRAEEEKQQLTEAQAQF